MALSNSLYFRTSHYCDRKVNV